MAITLRNCTFAFKCDKKWAQLAKTGNADVRFCDQCQREVFHCHDDEELVQSIALNRCVAIDLKNHLQGGEVRTMGLMISD